MNPILPLKHFVPDGEARQMPDGRLYLYGSYDISGETAYCSDRLHVFSTGDMKEWKDHGVVLRVEDIPWAAEGGMLYAPDCVFKDGKYYLYFCMNNAQEGVAVSDTPYGPFRDPVPVMFANGDGIDPAVLVDDDGQVYYFWGQFHLRGARMMEDMRTLDMETCRSCVLDEKNHGFHEGACIRKYRGKYYLLYTDTSRGRATCLSYAVSDRPLGPYRKGGTVIDNIFCDPGTWNDHGSLAEFNGSWYIFYHRSSQNSQFNRRMCVEPVSFDREGKISEVPMTTQGCTGPITVPGRIEAGRACQVRNGVYIAPGGGGEIITHAVSGSWAAYKYVDFREPGICAITASSATCGGRAEIWADQEKIGECRIDSTGSWDEFRSFSCPVKPTAGVKTLFLVFASDIPGSRLMDVKDIIFS